MDNPFLPDTYEAPETTSRYMKLKDGENRFRILSSAVVGYEYWNVSNKPVHSRTQFEDVPTDAKLDEDGQFKPRHFWAFVVWNYKEKAVNILELTQVTIQRSIAGYTKDPDWGSPFEYDLSITRLKEGEKVSYTVKAYPHKPLTEEVLNAKSSINVKLEALFDGKDPFAK